MTITYIYFIYGLCVMFYGMMAWFFLHKNSEKLSRLVVVLMIVLDIQCVKDLFFITPEVDLDSRTWMIMTAMDMIAVPLYAFVLIELCRPGTLNMRMAILHELPFVLFPALFAIIHNEIYYYANVVWAAIYGFGCALWAVIEIPKFNRFLKERLSYDENINLNWLRYVLLSFFVILSLWIVDCLIANYDLEAGYMLASLTIWMFICYFIYRHESVVDELNNPAIEDLGGGKTDRLSTC